MKSQNRQKVKEWLIMIAIILGTLLAGFSFIRLIIIDNNIDEYCELKFGEGFLDYKNLAGEERCIKVDYLTGEGYIKYYTFENYKEICKEPSFFDLSKWEWDCNLE